MTEEAKKILIDAGMNYKAASERFMGNDAILEKFLKKFVSDATYSGLLDAIEKRDVELAFRAAHTLKGVAANFSFDELSQAASNQTESFRAGNLEEGIELLAPVTECYEKLIAAIKQIFGDI